MKTFKSHSAFQAYNHPQKDKILKYLEAMYAVGSELNKIDNLNDRMHEAAKRSGLKIEDMTLIFEEKDEAFKNLRHSFLSEFQFHEKYANLQTFLIMMWNLRRESATIDKGEKMLIDMDRTVDLLEKLEQKTSRLFVEIYGTNEIIDVAKENIRTSQTVEQRLKNK